jgi:hypothetical protein
MDDDECLLGILPLPPLVSPCDFLVFPPLLKFYYFFNAQGKKKN